MFTKLNLAALEPAQQLEIEQDKQRWYEAYKMITTMYPHEIRAALAQMPEGEAKDDLRTRLNHMRGKYEFKGKHTSATTLAQRRLGNTPAAR